MLTLPIQRHGELIAIADDALPERLYVALARPRVARRADGSARLRLLRWATASGAAAAGGRLSVDVELHPSAEDIAAAGLAGRDIRPLPWLAARVRIDGPQFEPVEAEVALAAGALAALAVELSPSAAALLAPLLESSAVLPLQVHWSGAVQLRLPALEVIASADVHEVRRRLAIVDGALRSSLTRSVIEANARIEIRGGADAELERVLREWALHELQTRLAGGGALSVHAAASDVVPWPIELATTLDDFMPAASRSALVETLVLGDDELHRVPPIDVRVLGDFAAALERVDVRLESPAGGSAELAFVDDVPRSARLGSERFRWSRRVKRKGRAAGEWSAWQDGSSALLLPVAAPAARNIEVLAAGLDFQTRWLSARVVLTSGAGTGVVELNAANVAAAWTVPDNDAPDSIVQARVTLLSRHGAAIETGPLDVAGDRLIVGDPFRNHRLRVAVVPAGTGWGEVALAMIDLRYDDGAQRSDETIELRRLDDFVEWEVPARPDGPRQVQWRLHASFASGRFESGPWQSSEAGVIVVRIDGAPRREVQILPIHFDAALTKQARLRLQGEAGSATLTVTDRTPRRASLDGAGSFTWTLAWTKADGTELAESVPVEGSDVIVLPRFRG